MNCSQTIIWWRHIYVIWRNYLNLAVFKGVRGTPRQDLAFLFQMLNKIKKFIGDIAMRTNLMQ